MTAAAEPVARTEVEVAADTVAALIGRGVLRRDNAAVSRAAEAVGLMAGEVYAALHRREEHGWFPPRRVEADPTDDTDSEPVQNIEHQTPNNRAAFRRANPSPGMRRCVRCHEVKPVTEFNIRNKKTGNRASLCKPCAVDYARERYLSVNKVKMMNAVGLAFVVSDADDVTGLCCVDCGCPIKPGDRVHGQMELRHTECPAAPPPVPQVHKPKLTVV